MLVDAQWRWRCGCWEIGRDGRGDGLAGLEALFWGLRHDGVLYPKNDLFNTLEQDEMSLGLFVELEVDRYRTRLRLAVNGNTVIFTEKLKLVTSVLIIVPLS